MSEDLKAARKKQEAKKRIKELENKLKVEKAYASLGLESFEARLERSKKEKEEAYAAVSLLVKQNFLDFWRGGMNLGEAAKAAGITTDIAAEVILRNMQEYTIFPTKVKV